MLFLRMTAKRRLREKDHNEGERDSRSGQKQGQARRLTGAAEQDLMGFNNRAINLSLHLVMTFAQKKRSVDKVSEKILLLNNSVIF